MELNIIFDLIETLNKAVPEPEEDEIEINGEGVDFESISDKIRNAKHKTKDSIE